MAAYDKALSTNPPSHPKLTQTLFEAQSSIYYTDNLTNLLPAILLAPSITPTAVNAQHDPQNPYLSG